MKKEEDTYKNIMNFKCTNTFQNLQFFLKKSCCIQMSNSEQRQAGVGPLPRVKPFLPVPALNSVEKSILAFAF